MLKFSKITSVENGKIKVLFDGETVATERQYRLPIVTGVEVNDRACFIDGVCVAVFKEVSE